MQLHAPDPLEDRHVLGTRVEDDLDLGIGQDGRERPGIEPVADRVEQLDPRLRRAPAGRQRDLHQAEERAVAALGDELRINRHTAVLARQIRQLSRKIRIRSIHRISGPGRGLHKPVGRLRAVADG